MIAVAPVAGAQRSRDARAGVADTVRAPLTPARAFFYSAAVPGLAFSASLLPLAAVLKQSHSFNVVFRFGVTPLFLFSGVFFPVSQLPSGFQWVALVSPLYHGVELTRAFVLEQRVPPGAAVHVAYLCGLVAAGNGKARMTFRRKLHA